MGNSGVVGAALENSTSYSGLIADGHHVDWTTLRIAMQTRPIDRFKSVHTHPRRGAPAQREETIGHRGWTESRGGV